MVYTNHVRIIAGKFGSRQLRFPSALHLKPTGSRVRETLFNWLMYDIDGARCLDAFAGSGVLGFEALSRGAKSVRFLDNNPKVVDALKKNAAMLGCDADSVVRSGDVKTFIQQAPSEAFDLVFLDPPFHHDTLLSLLGQLVIAQRLTAEAKIYIEFAKGKYNLQKIPVALAVHKQKVIGDVEFALCGLA